MSGNLRVIVFLLLFGSGSLGVPAQEPVDQVAAVVDNHVITLSDLLWTIRYRGLEIPEEPTDRRDFLLNVLGQLVEQELIAREAAQTPGVLVTDEDVQRRFEGFRSRFPSEEAFQDRLREMQMSQGDLRLLISRQLAVLQFVKVRFEPFIIVLPDQIQEYYDQELVPELRRGGQEPPPLEVVEEQIRQVLTLDRTNAEVDIWVRNASRKAEVEVLLYRTPEWLPNVPRQFADELEPAPVSSGAGIPEGD